MTLPKTPLCTIFYSVCMLCEAETTANSDVFELAVAQNTTIYSVFAPAVQKHRNVAKNTAICEVFTFSRKEFKPRQCTKHYKNQCFAKTVIQTAPKSQNLAPRPPDKTHGKHTRRKTENRRPKVKHIGCFSLFSCRFRAGVCTN